jgi:hypothetical protein
MSDMGPNRGEVQITDLYCKTCQKRMDGKGTCVTESEFRDWAESSPGPDNTAYCAACFGILEFGNSFHSTIAGSLRDTGYTDIYGVVMSIQIPTLVVFRSYIEKAVFGIDGGSAEIKDVLRGYLTPLVRETPDDRMPKLFVEIQVTSLQEYHMEDHNGVSRKTRTANPLLEMPLELVAAVNNKVKQSKGFKKFKDKHSISSSDISAMFEPIKGDIEGTFRLLFPNDPTTDVSAMRSLLVSTFLTRSPLQYVYQVTLRRETLYLIGKYRKACRDFGQSHWDAHSTSVAETIVPSVCALFGNSPIEKCLFSASGREDMDVRMLGSGRNFVLQLGDAKSLDALKSIENFRIDSGDVIVDSGLRLADKGVLDWLHWSTEQHVKIYRCIVWSANKFVESTNWTNDLKVFQSTPLRVLHRRTEHVREKYIHAMELEKINDHFAIVTLRASAGAYIKEFIHGDFGRTTPCFNDVVFGGVDGNKCDILQLDVLEVETHEEEDYVPIWERN